MWATLGTLGTVMVSPGCAGGGTARARAGAPSRGAGVARGGARDAVAMTTASHHGCHLGCQRPTKTRITAGKEGCCAMRARQERRCGGSAGPAGTMGTAPAGRPGEAAVMSVARRPEQYRQGGPLPRLDKAATLRPGAGGGVRRGGDDVALGGRPHLRRCGSHPRPAHPVASARCPACGSRRVTSSTRRMGRVGRRTRAGHEPAADGWCGRSPVAASEPAPSPKRPTLRYGRSRRAGPCRAARTAGGRRLRSGGCGSGRAPQG